MYPRTLRLMSFVCSPLRGDYERNLLYVRRALRDSLMRGEAAFAPHALYTLPDVLDDEKTMERNMGISSGFSVLARCDLLAVYHDFGISPGMKAEIDLAAQSSIQIAYRKIWK